MPPSSSGNQEACQPMNMASSPSWKDTAMRTIVLVLIALLFAPAVTMGGPHLKKLHAAHQQHAHKHKMKKAAHSQCHPHHHGLHHKPAGGP
jgi:hypothetical protein